jgi:hypothetical protein
MAQMTPQTTTSAPYNVLARHVAMPLGQVVFAEIHDRVHGELRTLCRALLDGASEAQARARLQVGPAELARLSAALVEELASQGTARAAQGDDAGASPLPVPADVPGDLPDRCHCCGAPFASRPFHLYFCPACEAAPPYWFHGGQGGLPVGALLLPPTVTGNPRGSADRAAWLGYDSTRVYVTASRIDAVVYAAAVGGGDVYLVQPAGAIAPDPEPRVGTIVQSCDWARIVAVFITGVTHADPRANPNLVRAVLAVPIDPLPDEGRAA